MLLALAGDAMSDIATRNMFDTAPYNVCEVPVHRENNRKYLTNNKIIDVA